MTDPTIPVVSGRPSILVARAIFNDHLERLREHFDVEVNPGDEPFTATELIRRLAGKQAALITPSDRIDANILAALPHLKVVSTISVGTNHIDIAACTARGIQVTYTPDVLTETTADHAWALLLAAARRVTESERWLRAGHWQRWSLNQFLGVDLHHSTLGILGMGRIGQAIARRGAGFAMRVIYHNRSRLPQDQERAVNAEYVSKEDLLRRADHLIIVVPYSPSSHHMIGAQELALMKPGAVLVNIARGGIVDDAALAQTLQDKRITAAGLDVFEGEPSVHPGLLACENVALTPHIASATHATRHAMASLAIDNLIAALAGEVPPCLMNPEVLRPA